MLLALDHRVGDHGTLIEKSDVVLELRLRHAECDPDPHRRYRDGCSTQTHPLTSWRATWRARSFSARAPIRAPPSADAGHDLVVADLAADAARDSAPPAPDLGPDSVPPFAPAVCGAKAYSWLPGSSMGTVVTKEKSILFSLSKGALGLLLGLSKYKGVVTPLYDVTAYLMRYEMQDRGKKVEATMAMAYPTLPSTGSQEAPYVLWTHGTSGFSDACAPTKNAAGAALPVALMASQGYIGVAPDYIGMNGFGAAMTTLSAATVAISAATIAQSRWYGVESQLGDLLTDLAPNHLLTALPLLMDTQCSVSDKTFTVNSVGDVFTAGALDAIGTKGDWVGYGQWKCMAEANSLPDSPVKPKVHPPTLFVVSKLDQLVNPKTQRGTFDLLCGAGYQAEYLECQGAGHTEGALWSLPEQFAWVRDRLAGKPLTKVCQRGAPTCCSGSTKPPCKP